MLVKGVCARCLMRRYGWYENYGRIWDQQAVVLCNHWKGRNGWLGWYPIDREVPDECPYRLEHIVGGRS